MFKFHCDRCGREIKTVSGSEAKEIMLANDFLCNPCKKTEASFVALADKLRKTWDNRINTMVENAKKQLLAGLEGSKKAK